MRDKRGRKRGALTAEECIAKASLILKEHEMCLFIVDGQNFTRGNISLYSVLREFLEEANKTFADEFPLNRLAVRGRDEKGFQESLGDASWAGVRSVETIRKLIELKESKYPKLPLHYGVAIDAWSPGIELAK